MTEINTELFRKVHEQITAKPEHHDQRTYESDVDADVAYLREHHGEDADEEIKDLVERVDGGTVCGTTRCTAGWALYLHRPDQALVTTAFEVLEERGIPASYSELFDGARHLLGLDERQANELFAGDLSEKRAVALIAEYAFGDED